MEKKKLGIVGEFKTFISRGSIIDLAVGIIIGGAFTAIVTSLVNDILMPCISLFKKGGFSAMYVGIIEEGTAAADTTLANGAVIAEGEPIYRTYLYYGNFIQAIINFFLIAISIFLLVKVINTIRDKSEQMKKKLDERNKPVEGTAEETKKAE